VATVNWLKSVPVCLKYTQETACLGCRGDIPLNRALLAIHMPPPTSISPPMPPNSPFGGPPPPAPPNRALRRVSSPWMRAHASLGSGADMFAVCVGGSRACLGWRGRLLGGDNGRMELGDEVDDDGENGRRRITTADARDAPRHTSALLPCGCILCAIISGYPQVYLKHPIDATSSRRLFSRSCCLVPNAGPPQLSQYARA
jgi:hypothetical protein